MRLAASYYSGALAYSVAFLTVFSTQLHPERHNFLRSRLRRSRITLYIFFGRGHTQKQGIPEPARLAASYFFGTLGHSEAFLSFLSNLTAAQMPKLSSLAPSALANHCLSRLPGDAVKNKAFLSPCIWQHLTFSALQHILRHFREFST